MHVSLMKTERKKECKYMKIFLYRYYQKYTVRKEKNNFRSELYSKYKEKYF